MWSVWLLFVIVVFILSSLWGIRIRGLWTLPNGRDWLWGKLGLVLMGGAMLSKSLIQFSVWGNAVIPPCCSTWDQTMVVVMKIMATSFKRSHACTVALCVPDPVADHCRPTPLLETPGHSEASLSQSFVGSLLLSPGSLYAQGFVCQESISQSCGISVIKSHWPPKSNSLRVLSPFAKSPCWKICCGS